MKALRSATIGTRHVHVRWTASFPIVHGMAVDERVIKLV